MHWRIVPFASQYTVPLRQLFLDARRAAFTWQDPSLLALSDFDAATTDEQLLVAVHRQDTPIGFVAWWPPDNFVHSLFVAPAWQGRGVGRALLAEALRQLGRPATLKCLQANQAALRFYTTLGWVEAGTGGLGDEAYYLLAYSSTSPPGSRKATRQGGA